MLVDSKLKLEYGIVFRQRFYNLSTCNSNALKDETLK